MEEIGGFRALEFGGDAQAEAARERPIFTVHKREHAQGHESVTGGEVLPLQAGKISRPLTVPLAGQWRARGVDGADSAVKKRLHRRIRMRAAPRIVRVVDE